MTALLHIWAHVNAYVHKDTRRYLEGKWRPLRLDVYPERHRAAIAAYNETFPRAIQMIYHPTGSSREARKTCKLDGKELLEQCSFLLHEVVHSLHRRGTYKGQIDGQKKQ